MTAHMYGGQRCAVQCTDPTALPAIRAPGRWIEALGSIGACVATRQQGCYCSCCYAVQQLAARAEARPAQAAASHLAAAIACIRDGMLKRLLNLLSRFMTDLMRSALAWRSRMGPNAFLAEPCTWGWLREGEGRQVVCDYSH